PAGGVGADGVEVALGPVGDVGRHRRRRRLPREQPADAFGGAEEDRGGGHGHAEVRRRRGQPAQQAERGSGGRHQNSRRKRGYFTPIAPALPRAAAYRFPPAGVSAACGSSRFSFRAASKRAWTSSQFQRLQTALKNSAFTFLY